MNRTAPLRFSRPRIPAISWGSALSLLLLGGSVAPRAAGAATTLYYWTGASSTSGNWSAGANWLGGLAPVGGDQRLIFDTGAARKLNTNNLPAGTAFESVWIVDSGYNIYGNPIRTSLIRMDDTAGTSTFRPDILASGDLTLYAEQAGATLVIAGDISLSADDLRFPAAAAGDVTISGVISGTGNFYKYGSGEVALAGFGPNTFVGDTFVYGGILRLNRYNLGPNLTFPGTTAIPGDLTIGDFTGTLIGRVAALGRENQIADTSVVSVLSTGGLELSGENETVGELHLHGGTVLTGTGVLRVEGGIFAEPPLVVTKDSLIAGRLELGARGDGPQTIDVAQGVQLNISAAISGVSSATLIKTNRGELFLSASNTFSGDVEIAGGTLTISHGSALGTVAGVTKPLVGTLAVQGSIGIPETLEVPGPAGILRVDSGSPSWLGSVVLNDDLGIYVPTNSFLTIVGLISGPAGFAKYGPGTLQFKTTYTNTYGGVSRVAEGDMILDGVFHQPVIPGPLVIGTDTRPPGSERVSLIKNHQISDDAPITLNKSGLLALNGMTDTVGPLTFNGGAAETTASGLLTLNGDILVHATNQTASIHGQLSLGGAVRQINTLGAGATPDLLIAAAIADGPGPGGLAKVGAGSLVLSGLNSYTGETALSEGSLIVNGSLAASSRLYLNLPITPTNAYPALLGGNGTVPGLVPFSGGIIAPGASPGHLTVQGELALSNDVVRMELNGLVPGTSYDQLRANGAVNLGGSRLELSFGFTPAINDSFTLIRNDSVAAVQGTFLGLAQGSYFSKSGMVFYIDYNAGEGGNDVVLTRVAPPQPSLGSIMPVNPEQMRILGLGVPGMTYVLEATFELRPPVSWSPIGTTTANTLGIYEFIDTYADHGTLLYPQRFYRIR